MSTIDRISYERAAAMVRREGGVFAAARALGLPRECWRAFARAYAEGRDYTPRGGRRRPVNASLWGVFGADESADTPLSVYLHAHAHARAALAHWGAPTHDGALVEAAADAVRDALLRVDWARVDHPMAYARTLVRRAVRDLLVSHEYRRRVRVDADDYTTKEDKSDDDDR